MIVHEPLGWLQIKEEPCSTKELILVAGAKSISGYPAPSGVVISGFNSCKVPVPLLAVGTLAVGFKDSQLLEVKDETLKVYFFP